LLLQVYKGRRKYTGQITAMKFIGKHNKSEKDIKSLRQEIEILRQLRHENVIQMLDAFETKTDFCVVTEFAHGAIMAAASIPPLALDLYCLRTNVGSELVQETQITRGRQTHRSSNWTLGNACGHGYILDIICLLCSWNLED
jgi:Protein kinase domain